jgi:hypothetical protein
VEALGGGRWRCTLEGGRRRPHPMPPHPAAILSCLPALLAAPGPPAPHTPNPPQPPQASGFCYINDLVLAILELLKRNARVGVS